MLQTTRTYEHNLMFREDFMGKNKSTKSDGKRNFADTQDLGNKTRYPAGAEPNVKTSSTK